MAIDDSLALTAFLPAEAPAASHAELALRALQRMVDATTRIAHFDELLPQALRIVVDVFDAKSAGYFEHPTDERIYLRFWLYDGRVYAPADLPHIDEARYGLMRRLADGFTVPDTHLGVNFRRRSAPSIVHHATATASPELHAFAVSMGWEWGLNAPLMVDGHADGAIAIFRGEAHPFSSDDIALANALCKQIALAMRMCKLAERDRELVAAREREASARAHAVELERANRAMRASIEGLARLDDLDQFLAQTLRAAIEAAGAQGGAVCLVEGDDVVTPVLIGVEGVIPRERQLREGTYRVPYSPLLKEAAASTVSSQRSWSVAPDDPMHPPGFLRFHAKQGNRALRLIPLRVGDRMLGWLGLGFREADPELGEHFSLLGVLAEQVTMAVEMLRVAAEAGQTAVERERALAAEQRAGEFASANEVLRRGVDLLSKATSSDEVLGIFLSQAVEVTRAAAGAVLRQVDGTEHAFVALYEDGHPVPLPARGDDLLVEEARRVTREDRDGMVRRILAGEAFWVPVDDTLATWAPGAYAYHTQRGHRGFWNTPYRVSAAINGYLALAFTTEHEPTPTMRETYRALANQVALAIELNRLADEARDAAIVREQEASLRASERARADELARANEVLRRSVSGMQPDEPFDGFIGRMLIEITRVAGASLGAVILVERTTGLLRMRRLCRFGTLIDLAHDDAHALWREPFSWSDFTSSHELLHDAMVIDDLDALIPRLWPPSVPWHRAMGHRALLMAPLRCGARIVGLLGMGFDAPTRFTESQRELVRALANQISLVAALDAAAEGARDAEVLRERERAASARAVELGTASAALQKTIDAVARLETMAAFVPHALHIVGEAFGALSCGFFVHGDDNLIHLRYWLHEGRVYGPQALPGLDAQQLGLVKRMAAGFEVPHSHLDADPYDRVRSTVVDHRSLRGNVELQRLALSIGWEIELNIPLVVDQRAEGALVIYRRADRPFTAADISLGETLSKQIAFAMQTHRLAEREREAAVVRERVAELARANEALSRSVVQLSASTGLQGFLMSVLREAIDVSGAVSGSVCTLDVNDPQVLVQRVLIVRGEEIDLEGDPRGVDHRAGVPIGDAERRATAGEPRAIVWLDQDDPERRDDPRSIAFHREHGHRFVAIVPMLEGDRSMGYLGLAYDRSVDVQPSAARIELCRVLAQQAVLAMRLSRLADDASAQAVAAAVARERERAAQTRLAEFVRANEALRISSEKLVTLSDLSRYLDELLIAAAHVSAAAAGGIGVLDPDGRHVRLVSTVEDSGADGALVSIPPPQVAVPLEGDMRLVWAQIESARGYWSAAPEDPGFTDAYRAYHVARGHRTIVHVAMRLRGRTIGFLALCFRPPRLADDAQLEMIGVLAQQAALALEMTRLADENRRQAVDAAIAVEQQTAARGRAAELAKANEALRRSVDQLAQKRDLASFLEHILCEAMRMLDGAVAQIFLYDKQRNQLAASLGVDREHRIVPAPGLMGGLPISEPFAADITPAWPRLVAARRPLQWDVDRDAHEFWPGTLEWHRSMGHRGSVCVAMMMGDEPLGMLGIAFFQRDAISEAEFEFIQALGQQAALAIQYSRLAHEAEQAALVREQRTAALARAEELANANEVLSESLSRMLGEPKLDAFLDHVLVETCAHAGAHSNALFLYDKQTGALSMQRYLEDGRFVEIATTPGFDLWRAPVPPDVVDRWRASMQARKQLFHRLDDAPDRWPSAHLWHIERGLRSVLVIALGAGTSSFGLLALGYRHETEVPANEIELVQALANQASMALHLTRLADEARDAAVVREREIAAQQRAAELARANAVLRSVNARLAGEDDLDQFLLHVLDEAAGLIGATDGAVFLLDASRTHLALVNALFDGQRAEALPGHPYGHGEPVPLDRFAGWAQVAQARGQPIVANLRTFVGLPPETLAWHQARRHEYMTLSVLMLGDQPVGLMALATRRAQAIAPEQLDALEALGQQAALSVRAAHLAERVRDAALADQRNQLARDIHDSLAQSFTSIAMQTEALLSRFIVDVQLERTLQKVMRTARLGIAEARATALALRPLDNRLGAIDEALAGLAERSSIHDATRCAFASRGLPLLLPMEVQDALLRIAQEAVNNALKHSGGTHIELDLDYAPASVTLTVADDGRGVRVPSGNNGGLGMSGMRARAEALGGRFAIESRVGSHTRVVVTIPIAAEGKTV